MELNMKSNNSWELRQLTDLLEHWVPVRPSKLEAMSCQLPSPKASTAVRSWLSSSSVHSLFNMEAFKLLWYQAKHWNGVLLLPNDTEISIQLLIPLCWTMNKRFLSSILVHGLWLINGSSKFNHLQGSAKYIKLLRMQTKQSMSVVLWFRKH